jgi:phage terminase large subunit GpA-like protein
MINKALHALDVGDRYYKTGKRGLNVGYCFPTAEELRKFSKERFGGLESETEYLTSLFTGFDETKFKQVRSSYLYFVGVWSTKAVRSFAADILILDEYDEMDKAARALAQKRLAGSVLGIEIDLSTPTLPNKGINALYLRSDQHVWETLCIDCGEFNQLDFFRDVHADIGTKRS